MDRSSRLLAFAVLALLPGVAARAQPANPLPQVRVLATGGTIAGTGSPTSSSYRSGQVTVADLIAAVPGIATVAAVSGEQVANTASGNIDEAIWRKLHASAMAAIADPAISGVVITHGTDTLEETALFLSLVLPRTKPVVVVGSMRPSTAISADGPQNLMDAVRVAASPRSAGRGVMVVMNDSIFDPVSVTKVDVHRIEAFAAPTRGPIGDVLQQAPRFFAPATSAPARPSLPLLDAKLPKVAVVYAYAGLTGDDVRNAAKDAAGLIIAGVGAGGFPSSARDAVRELTARGVHVVRTARQGFGDIWPSDEPAGNTSETAVRTISGRELTPAKARILLMLALQEKRSHAQVQALFNATAGSD